MANFTDNFSMQAGSYSKYRPAYPPELFQYLGTLTTAADLAWDCGTGNGQSALGLVDHFKNVIASDPSAQQVKNAIVHERIHYKVETAEESSLADNSVDLLTIAQALHWFNFEKFYTEAKRVLKKDGIIAAWAYAHSSIEITIDSIMLHFHEDVVGEFWQYENRLIEKEYTTIPFPFQQLTTPGFYIKKDMSLNEFLGYISSWSAVQKFISKNGYDPCIELKDQLKEHWNEEDRKQVGWKLILKVGKNL